LDCTTILYKGLPHSTYTNSFDDDREGDDEEEDNEGEVVDDETFTLDEEREIYFAHKKRRVTLERQG
jgi:hypothetical protein